MSMLRDLREDELPEADVRTAEYPEEAEKWLMRQYPVLARRLVRAASELPEETVNILLYVLYDTIVTCNYLYQKETHQI